MDFTKVRLLICFCYVCTWLVEDQTVWSQFALPHNRNTQLLFWECFWKERSAILVFFFSLVIVIKRATPVFSYSSKEQAESFWGSSYLRSKSVLGYDPDYSKNELCSSSLVLRCFRRTWPWNTAACFAAVHRYSNAQEIKKKVLVSSVCESCRTQSWLPRVSGGVYSQVVFLSCLYRNLWAPASGRQLPSGPCVDENYKQENWAASMLSTSFPALHSSFPQACRFIPSPCCSEIVQRNVNSRLVRLCENAPPEAMTLSISATFRC